MKGEKKPISFASIEMRKGSNKSIWIGLPSLLAVAIIAGSLLFSNKGGSQPPILSSTPLQPPVSLQPSLSSIIGKRTKTSDCVSLNGLPDKACTPGDIDPAVTQNTIQQTICVNGYTKTVRPSVSYTDKLKIKQIQEYGYSDTSTKDYEEDHLISLELGGSPTSEANLWPETYTGTLNAREKDKVENYLHEQICSGKITLQNAQLKIATNWEEIYKILP